VRRRLVVSRETFGLGDNRRAAGPLSAIRISRARGRATRPFGSRSSTALPPGGSNPRTADTKFVSSISTPGRQGDSRPESEPRDYVLLFRESMGGRVRTRCPTPFLMFHVKHGQTAASCEQEATFGCDESACGARQLIHLGSVSGAQPGGRTPRGSISRQERDPLGGRQSYPSQTAGANRQPDYARPDARPSLEEWAARRPIQGGEPCTRRFT
jgi:hypothetical protein